MFVNWQKVREAIQLGLIQLVNCPNCNEIACQIGKHCFYFDTHDDYEYRTMNAETYAMRVSIDSIAEMVVNALERIAADSFDEFLYYRQYLLRNGIEIIDSENAPFSFVMQSATKRSGGNSSSGNPSSSESAPGNIQTAPDKHDEYSIEK